MIQNPDTFKEEFEKCFGFLPPFLHTIGKIPGTYRLFWQQTKHGYIKNRLPEIFRARVLTFLAQYFSSSDYVLYHRKHLLSLGMAENQITIFLNKPFGEYEKIVDINDNTLHVLPVREWPKIDTPLETFLLHVSVLHCLNQNESSKFLAKLRLLLSVQQYMHWVEFMGFCLLYYHWAKSYANPEVEPVQNGKRDFAENNSLSQQNIPQIKIPSTTAKQTKGKSAPLLSENQLKYLLSTLPADILLFSPQMDVLWVNQSMANAYGFAPEEMIGRNWYNLLPETISRQSLHQRVLKGEEIDILHARIPSSLQKNKKLVANVYYRSVPFDDQTNGMLICSVDLKIPQEVEKFETVLEVSPHAVILIDKEGCIHLINPEAERLFAYERGELLGHFIESLLPEALGSVHKQYRENFVKHPKHRSMGAEKNIVGRRKDGSTFPIEVGLSPIHTQHGLRVLASVSDISDRRIAEEIAAQKTKELERSNKELSQFANIASHDLQEPLRMVSSYTELMTRRYHDKLDEKANRYLFYMKSGANRMKELIDALLSYSRVGNQNKNFQKIDCQELLENVIHLLRIPLKQSQGKITFENLPTIFGDELQFSQVFQNLIGNALKFQKPGTKPQIHIQAKQQNDQWIFSIEDNGIGIDKAQKERVFQMFQRLHERDQYPGSGIGLAIVKKIVENHGGNVWFESIENKGTTFFITLPIHTL